MHESAELHVVVAATALLTLQYVVLIIALPRNAERSAVKTFARKNVLDVTVDVFIAFANVAVKTVLTSTLIAPSSTSKVGVLLPPVLTAGPTLQEENMNKAVTAAIKDKMFVSFIFTSPP